MTTNNGIGWSRASEVRNCLDVLLRFPGEGNELLDKEGRRYVVTGSCFVILGVALIIFQVQPFRRNFGPVGHSHGYSLPDRRRAPCVASKKERMSLEGRRSLSPVRNERYLVR